jgi:hypothetical protein
VRFQQLASEGLYQHEPDFPWLFHRYEQAIQQASQSRDPSFYPPADFGPHLSASGRLQLWRSQSRFPELDRAMLALLLMSKRALEKKPAITRAEWDQLQAWYLAERHRLPAQSGSIMLPTGKSVCRSSIDHEVKRYDGILIHGAENAFHDLQLLYHHFGNKCTYVH